jgi:hypothetical protein
LALAENATDPAVQKQYEHIAENYLLVAKAEDALAERLEKIGPIRAGLRDHSDF